MTDTNISGDDDIEEQFIALMRRARSTARDTRYKWERSRHNLTQSRERDTLRRQQRRRRDQDRPDRQLPHDSQLAGLVELAARLAAAQQADAHHRGDDTSQARVSPGAMETLTDDSRGQVRPSPEEVIARARERAAVAASDSEDRSPTTDRQSQASVTHLNAWRDRAWNMGIGAAALDEALHQNLDADHAHSVAEGAVRPTDADAQRSVEELAEEYTADSLDQFAAFGSEAEPTAADLIAAASTGVGDIGVDTTSAPSATQPALVAVPTADEGMSL